MTEIKKSNTEEIILVSLANTGVFKTYEVSSKEEISEAYKDFNDILSGIGLGNTDIETQAGFCSYGLDDRNIDKLYEYFELSEDTGAELETVISMDNYFNSLDDVKRILDNGTYSIYEGDSFNGELGAFITMCEEWEIFSDVPSHLIGYIDFEKYYQDWGYNGGITIELQDNRYIFID